MKEGTGGTQLRTSGWSNPDVEAIKPGRGACQLRTCHRPVQRLLPAPVPCPAGIALQQGADFMPLPQLPPGGFERIRPPVHPVRAGRGSRIARGRCAFAWGEADTVRLEPLVNNLAGGESEP